MSGSRVRNGYVRDPFSVSEGVLLGRARTELFAGTSLTDVDDDGLPECARAWTAVPADARFPIPGTALRPSTRSTDRAAV
jgi:hypothetical protein